MAGNYGGSSIPTTPIGGSALYGGRETTYHNYRCTTVVASADTGAFTYKNELFTLGAAGASIDVVIEPKHLTAAPTAVFFLCYDCDCMGPMTGTTKPSLFTYSGTPMYAPTIIGGGGLNS